MKYETVTNCYLCGQSNAKPIGQLGRFMMMRCKSCSFSYINQRPEEPEMDALYREYFSGETEDYGKCYQKYIEAQQRVRDRKIHLNRFNKGVLRKLRQHVPGNRLLDIGCAAGFFMQDAQNAGWDAVGIDIAKPALDFAKTELKMDVYYGRLIDQNFPENSIDAVTMFDLIEHLYSPLVDLQETGRILKPGGILCIYTPNVDSIKRKIQRGRWYAFKPREHNYYFSRQTITAMLGISNFEVLDFKTGYTRFLILPNFRNRLRNHPFILKSINVLINLVNQTIGRIIFTPFEMINLGDAILLFARKKRSTTANNEIPAISKR